MDRCRNCEAMSYCPICNSHISAFKHIGVHGTRKSIRIPVADVSVNYENYPSGVWHYAQPCGHRIEISQNAAEPVYHGGPLWQNGYRWINVYWGSYFSQPSVSSWLNMVDRATSDIETNPSYSGGLSQYNVGMGSLSGRRIINDNPPHQLQDSIIAETLANWISGGLVENLGTKGAYNIFLPPGTYAILSSDYSCQTFCDYHNTANGEKGPFYTVEPYPCASGCNQCTQSDFDTLTMGLSEEMVELKTDMDPGTGWLIGNLELCDYCDENFVCNTLSTGEYVNAWYDNATHSCWKR